MRPEIFHELGTQLRQARKARHLTQPQLAMRLGRDRARISDLERDLLNSRFGKDRLTLLADICDALDLVPVLVPRAQAKSARAAALPAGTAPPSKESRTSAFEDVFVDLTEEDEDE